MSLVSVAVMSEIAVPVIAARHSLGEDNLFATGHWAGECPIAQLKRLRLRRGRRCLHRGNQAEQEATGERRQSYAFLLYTRRHELSVHRRQGSPLSVIMANPQIEHAPAAR